MPTTFAEAAIAIDAPLATVWDVILDLDAYREWNPFIVRVEGGPRPADLRVGSTFKLHVRFHDGRAASSTEEVTRLNHPRASGDGARLEYDFCGPLRSLRALRATRVQALEQATGGPTRYFTREEFTGYLTMFLPMAKVRDGFTRHAAALKARAESLARAAK